MGDDTTRRGFLVAAGTGTVAALAGCASNPPSETETTEETDDGDDGMDDGTDTEQTTTTPEGGPQEGGTLRLASIGAIQTLDPVNAKGSGAGYNQYAEPLLTFPDGDLPPEPKLAEDFSISDDGITYTFQLKEGVQFHNGDELTATDVVYSWERIAQSDNSRNKDDIVGGTFTVAHEKDPERTDPPDEATPSDYVPGTLQIRAPEEYTFEFDLETAFHGTLSQIAGGTFATIPENSVGDIELDGIETEGEYEYNVFFGTEGDGPTFAATGPFQVEAWSKGSEIVLSRFEDYHDEGPYLDEITFTVLSGSEAAYQRFQNQNLDVLGTGSGSFPTTQFDPDNLSIENSEGSIRTGTYGPMQNDETVNYGEATVLDTDYILFNCDRTDRVVRRAIAYMMNQREIADQVYKGIQQPAYSITPPPVYPTHESDMNPTEAYQAHTRDGELSQTDFAADGYPYGIGETRIDEATRIMEEAGYGEDDMYEVTLTVFEGSSEWDQIANRLRDKATAAHIDMTINKASFGTIISQGGFAHEMDMFSLGDGMEWPESDNFLRFLHPSVASADAGFTQWGRRDDDGNWANEFMQQAEDAWQNLYNPNRGAGEGNQVARDEAYLIIEETNWAAVQELPTTYGRSQRFWYQDVNMPMAGTMENQTFNTTWISQE